MKRFAAYILGIVFIVGIIYAAYETVYIFKPQGSKSAIKSLSVTTSGKLNITDQSSNVMEVLSQNSSGDYDLGGGLTMGSTVLVDNPIDQNSIGTNESAISGTAGNVIKFRHDTDTLTATSAGAIVKGYFESSSVTNGNYEQSGLIVYHKNASTQAGGAKTSVASFHTYTGTTTDYGLRVFGDATTGMSFESGTNTQILDVSNRTTTYLLKGADGKGGVTVGAGTYSTADGYIEIQIGSSTYRIPFYSGVD